MSDPSRVAPENPSPCSLEDERKEFNAVVAALPKSSRQLRLITYIGQKYFQDRHDELHEYNIATEVFERSKTSFNAGEDAIVRVEAHRLRKKLSEYYENEGKDHPIHLSIPLGTYAPVFTRPNHAPAEIVNKTASAQLKLARQRAPLWIYPAAALVLVLTALGIYGFLRAHRAKEASPGATAAPASMATSGNAAHDAQVPLRILAGYSGKPQIDRAGAVWQPDQYFHEGGPWDNLENSIGRTSDPMLFKHWRNGDFSYDFPLSPGVYELHLYFFAEEPDATSMSTFTVYINGDNVLQGFDIRTDAFGSNTADERIFRDVGPSSDGMLHLRFTSERAPASLSAIEILPGMPHRQLPIRLVMQSKSFTDHNGQFWRPDDYYMNGYSSTKRAQIEGTLDPDQFAGERYGNFSYAIPVDTRDRYTLILHFAEFYFGPRASGVGGVGSRVFRVLCNGNTLLDDFDIYKEVGSLRALTKPFNHLKPTAQGKLNITFEPIMNNAAVSGIEVIDEGQ
ncbi:MAG: malectin domain-containing carbohydrate-binding protein [Terracidiphilus sp.]